MRYTAAFALLATIVPVVTAQASAYGQCGGSGWAGSTTCVSGYVCTASSQWYSQCVPGTATSPPTTTGGSSPPTTTGGSGSGSVDTKERCGQYDSVVAGPYTLYLNQWGISGASGKQCAHLTGLSGNTVSYVTNWQWSGGNGVKTYTNINLNQGLNKQLSAIKSMPSTYTWSFTGSNVVSDVAYDLFTSATSGGSNAYEIMVWLANQNAGPISYNYGSDGKPVALVSNLNIAGHNWNLYYGTNGANYVYSFLPVSGTVPSFSGDINLFLKYLTANQKLPTSQYLTTFQSGSEPSSGSGTLTVSAYSAAIN